MIHEARVPESRPTGGKVVSFLAPSQPAIISVTGIVSIVLTVGARGVELVNTASFLPAV